MTTIHKFRTLLGASLLLVATAAENHQRGIALKEFELTPKAN